MFIHAVAFYVTGAANREVYMKGYFHLRVRLVTLAIALMGMFMGAGFASASDTGWLENQSHPAAKARFVMTGQTDPAQKTIEGFLEVDLDQGWKTYWRSPGEGGIAPSIDWGQSTNISRVEWHWPYPQQFSLLGLHTLGYQGDTVIPITMHVEDWTQPVHINAEFTLSSCTTICVLTEYPISLAFNPGELVTSEEDMFTYAQAISKVPKPSPQLSDVTAHWDAEKQLLVVKLTKASVWKKPEVIVDGKTEESQEYSYKPEDTYVEDNQLTATFAVSSWLGDINFGQQSVYITVKDDAFLAEESASVQSGVVSALTEWPYTQLIISDVAVCPAGRFDTECDALRASCAGDETQQYCVSTRVGASSDPRPVPGLFCRYLGVLHVAGQLSSGVEVDW